MPTAPPRNLWPDAKCAKAFWGQHDLPPYRRLLADTVDDAAPAAGERWLDLGCGGGALTRAVWERTGGRVAEVVGADCAAANATVYARLGRELGPKVRFECHDFSAGLAPFADASFDGVVSGLAMTYAEHWDADAGRWTDAAYNRLLAECFRVLKPGGRLVCSLNVPEPSWNAVALRSLPAALFCRRPLRHLKRCVRMLRYGRWLHREARSGRFHYLPADDVAARLRAAGFADASHRLSYSGQAYIFRAAKAAH